MPSPVRADRESQSPAPTTAAAAGSQPAKGRWFSGLSNMFGQKPSEAPAVQQPANALLAFPSESTSRRAEPPPRERAASVPEAIESTADATIVNVAAATVSPMSIAPSNAKAAPADVPPAPAGLRRRPRTVRIAVVAACIAGIAGPLAFFAARGIPLRAIGVGLPQTGALTIQTQPDGAEVLIDGNRRGVTPLTLTVPAGAHTLTVQSEADRRVVPLIIGAGSDVTQHFEMKTPEPASLFGKISVTTDPPGAHVLVDGRPRGVSPLVVTDLSAEEHTVAATNDNSAAERKVMVGAGGTASVMFSLAKAAGPVAGWVAVSAPFDVEIAENADVIGAPGTTRVMLASGRHDIVLTNRSVGYQESRRIEIIGGKTTPLRVEAPRVGISVNARPWADVLVDGANIGQTPIANVQVALGTHELVFRHPQLGERRQTILVTAKGNNRIAADLTK